MANTVEKDTASAVTNSELASAVKALADIAIEQQTSAKIPQTPLSKAKIVTPWNPTGERKRPQFTRKTAMNGYRLHESRMSNEEISLFNQLKAGKYYTGKWIVVERDANGQSPSVDLYVPNKTKDQQFEIARLVGQEGLVAILRMIVAEQKAA